MMMMGIIWVMVRNCRVFETFMLLITMMILMMIIIMIMMLLSLMIVMMMILICMTSYYQCIIYMRFALQSMLTLYRGE